MARKSRYRSANKLEEGWDCRLLEILVSVVTSRTFVIYDLSDGDFEDIGTNVERRCAIFEGSGYHKDLREEIAKGKEGKSYYYGFEGLPGAIYDEPFEDTQEADEDAERHKSQSEALSSSNGGGYGASRNDPALYENFMNAIDIVAEDDTNEEAWAAIDAWRNRLAVQHER